jgi:hypothetical protein
MGYRPNRKFGTDVGSFQDMTEESLPLFSRTRFFDSGYQDGFAHGRIHGLIEGRALGREKGFEMWEELGFYQGFALAWEAAYLKQDRTQECVCAVLIHSCKR